MLFALELHCDAVPLIPLFPLKLSSLMTFAAWASVNGINGWDSVACYIGDVVAWAASYDSPDPRVAGTLNEQIWSTFVRNYPKIVGGKAPDVKLRLQVGHLECMFLDMNVDSWFDRRDRCAYLLLWYTACRIGHVAPAAPHAETLSHVLHWSNLKFVPSLLEPDFVFFYFPSTKTRPLKSNRPWFTAVGRVADPSVCLVTELRRHFCENYAGDPDGFVFTRGPEDGGYYTRTAFTDILRARLAIGSRHLGMAPGELDLSAFSGISFRKGSLQTLADGGTPSYALADAADHNTIDSTRFYVGDTVQARAARMASIGDGFAPDALPTDGAAAAASATAEARRRRFYGR